jgi:hypothetical protein
VILGGWKKICRRGGWKFIDIATRVILGGWKKILEEGWLEKNPGGGVVGNS